MKPLLEHLPKEADESFVVRFFDYQYFPTPWHFHPEYEIVLVTKSTGKRFIGDNICNFKHGDLALIGPNLPHLYRNDAKYYEPSSKLKATSIVVHFLEDSFGEYLEIPEAAKIKTLLNKSSRGLNISGQTNTQLRIKILQLLKLQGFERAMKLMEILHLMSVSDDITFISGDNIAGVNNKESERMDNVLKYMLKNFNQDISLADVAKEAKMVENSFSRFFKQRTRKTFSNYLTELRLNHAAKLLIENEQSVLEICYTCGFNNPSNFYRYFKQLYGNSPLSYRKAYLNK